MNPYQNQAYDPAYLDPLSAYRRRPPSNRRSSASWTDGVSAMGRQLSASSSQLTPTSHTSDDVHQSVLDDSFFQNPTADPYFWGNNTPTPMEDPPLSGDNQNLFPALGLVPGTPNTNDGLLNLDHLDPMPNNPQSLFLFTIRRLEEEFNRHPDPAAYAVHLARRHLDEDTFLRSVSWTQQDRPARRPPATRRAINHCPRYRCLLCTQERIISTRGSFKRHVNDKHFAKSLFMCMLCDESFHRRDKLVHHLKNKHSAHARCNHQEISNQEVAQSIPSSCHICVRHGLQVHVPPFGGWDGWFEGIEEHCRLPTEEPPPAQSSFPPDHDGGGAGGSGSAFSGWAGTSPGPNWAALFGSNWSLFPTGLGSPYNGRSVSGSSISRDTPADGPDFSGVTSTRTNGSNHSNGDSFSDNDSPLPFRNLRIPQCPLDDISDDDSKGSCSRCGHENNSCSSCPRRRSGSAPCHLCQDRTALVSSSKIFSNPDMYVTHGGRFCCPVSKGDNMLASLSHGVANLSLGCQPWEPVLKPSEEQVFHRSSKSACYRHGASMRPLPHVTVTCLSATINGSDPMFCLVVCINQLCQCSSVAPHMDLNFDSKIAVDAIMAGQKTLECIHRDPPVSRQKLVKQLTRCHVTLDAIDFELSSCPPSPHNRSQKARQKRLSTLLARLRAVTFILSLQKEVTPEIPDRRPFDDSTQLSLTSSIGKTISPFTARKLRDLYDLVHKHLYGDFWAHSGMLGPPKPFAEDTLGVFSFLQALVMGISDPKLSFLRKYTGNDPYTLLDDNIRTFFRPCQSGNYDTIST